MKHSWILIAAAALAACTDSPVSSPASPGPRSLNTGQDQVCPNTGDDAPAWTKIDSGSGAASGDFGSFTYGGRTLAYSISNGYTAEFCIKSGSNVGKVNHVVTDTGDIVIAQDISHVSWRVARNQAVQDLVALTVQKDARTSHERVVEWELSKTVDQSAFTGKPGSSFTATWTVAATRTRDELRDYRVVGEIRITNPNPVDVSVAVADTMDDGTVVTPDCPSTTVPARGELVCTYTAAPAGMSATRNRVTVTVAPGSYTAPAGYQGEIAGGVAETAVLWGAPTLVGDASPTLGDARFGYEAAIGESTTFTRAETFACPAYSAVLYPADTYTATATNVATLTGNGVDLSRSAQVTLACNAVWANETATGRGTPWSSVVRGVGNWFMYTPFTTGTVDLVAGQHHDAGDITMTRSGTTTAVTIQLHDGFRLANVSNSVKIHPMAATPTSYVQPGQYSVKRTPSGTTITVSGLASTSLYAIHLDVQRLVP
jgi:hypothetical protein